MLMQLTPVITDILVYVSFYHHGVTKKVYEAYDFILFFILTYKDCVYEVNGFLVAFLFNFQFTFTDFKELSRIFKDFF